MKHTDVNSSAVPCLSVTVSEEYLGDSAPVSFQGGIIRGMRQAAETGYTGVEIHVRNPADLNSAELKSAADSLGITISAVGTGLEYSLNGLCFTSPDKHNRAAIGRRFREHIDLARELNASVFVGLCRGKAPDYASCSDYLERFAEEITPVQQYADEKNVLLVLEPITYYMTNLLNTVEECLEFIKRPGLGSMQLLLDTHHMFLEDKNMYRAFDTCIHKIGHIHISDSNRRYPGAGNIDFHQVALALQRLDYTGPVSLEVLPYPTGSEAARLGIMWMKQYW